LITLNTSYGISWNTSKLAIAPLNLSLATKNAHRLIVDICA
jgi:hypothetical protein